MKKHVGIILTMCIIAMQLSAMAMDELYFNDGGITINGTAPYVRPGEKVTMLVIPYTVDWLNKEVREEKNPDHVVYFGSETVASDGGYCFKFYLADSGKYNVYITEGNEPTQNGKPEIVKQIVYINKSKSAEASVALKEAVGKSSEADTSPIEEVMNKYSEGLGLYDNIFEDENMSFYDTAKIAYSELAGLSEYEPIRITDIFEKSALAAMLNSGVSDAVNKYAYIVYDEASIYDKTDAKAVYDYLKDKDIKSVKELERLSDEAIVIVKANSGDASKINAVLEKVFAKKLYPEYAAKISLKLSSEISKKNNWTIEDIKKYIQNYNAHTESGPSVKSGGGGGGGVISGGPSVPAASSVKQELSEFIPFKDIENVKWAHEAIIGLYNKGCISGRADGIFAPDDSVLREEFLKMLVSVFDLKLVSSDSVPFEDVDKGAWYYDYVRTAYITGVTNGISDTLFGIGQSITRQDLCKMTVNLTDGLGKSFEEQYEISFADDTDISDYAREAVYILAKAGIVSGKENNKFDPFGEATRAEAAKILYYTMMFEK